MRATGARLLKDADVVVPVPLHPRREYQRGFNQAEDLARQLGLPVAPL
jgi:competence protein ComFC